jgi:hypothetical protein
MGILERIKEIEAEMARTQKNKATGFCCLLPSNNETHAYLCMLFSLFPIFVRLYRHISLDLYLIIKTSSGGFSE